MDKLCWSCFQKITEDLCPHCGFNISTQQEKYPLALQPGAILNGRYIVGRVLGQGGFGITYIAWDDLHKERVAIKEYLPAEFAGRENANSTVRVYSEDRRTYFEHGKEQFLDEAKTLAEFNGNQHIVRVFVYFEENNTAYFAMEFVDGESLDKYMAKLGGRLGIEAVCQFLMPVMDALDQVHSKGIVHRDIAPDNVLITEEGIAKLIDFGAARYSTGQKSKTLDRILKEGFSPKEQYMAKARQGPFTDVYAMAATYYYAITGKIPPESLQRLEEDELVAPSTLGVKIPAGAEDVLLKALEISAQDRYQTMGEFRHALEAEVLGNERKRREEEERLRREQEERLRREQEERLRREVEERKRREEERKRREQEERKRREEEHKRRVAEAHKLREEEERKRREQEERKPKAPVKIKKLLLAVVACALLACVVLVILPRGKDKNINEYFLMEYTDANPLAFNAGVLRQEVKSITFLSSLDNAPNDAVDASLNNDGTVKVWVVENGNLYDLFIAADGIICAPENSSYLFADMSRLQSISFGDAFCTDHAIDMHGMFRNCYNLTKLDLSSFDTSNVVDMSEMFSDCHKLTKLDVSNFDTSNVTTMKDMFFWCERLINLDLSSFDTSNVTNMNCMFFWCSNLTSLNLRSFNISSVTDMRQMFTGCSEQLTSSLDSFDFSSMEDFQESGTDKETNIAPQNKELGLKNVLMGNEYNYLGDIAQTLQAEREKPAFNTEASREDVVSITFLSTLANVPADAVDVSAARDGSVFAWTVKNGNLYDLFIAGEGGVAAPEDSSYLFSHMSNLKSINFGTAFFTDNVVNMGQMFLYCGKLKSLELNGFNTSNVTVMCNMFGRCYLLTELDLSCFDTSNVTNMSGMFFECNMLERVDLSSFDTSNVTDMTSMFLRCYALETLDLSSFDTSNVTDMRSMFWGSNRLTELDLSNFDFSAVKEHTYFMGAGKLVNGQPWENLFKQ